MAVHPPRIPSYRSTSRVGKLASSSVANTAIWASTGRQKAWRSTIGSWPSTLEHPPEQATGLLPQRGS